MSGAPTDVQVLQYALTLEHLEATYYAQALANFTQADFEAAGYPDWVRNRYEQIASHEADHVTLLTGALGNASTAACTYDFGAVTDVTSFIGLATLLEHVGVSAYSGAAQFITEPAVVTIAAVILSTEARHQAWQSSAVGKNEPWVGPYDTALDLDMVFTLASQFIVSCPSTNPTLPVKAFGALTVTPGTAGQAAQFTFDNSAQGSAAEYAIFYDGVAAEAVMLDENHMATVPASLQGVTYAVVSTAASPANVTDSNIVAGPAFIVNHFKSSASNPMFTGM